MSIPITIPDLRFEQSFKAKLYGKILKENEKNNIKEPNRIPVTLVVSSLIYDQVFMPFVQSFVLTSVLFYVRPLIAFSGRKTYLLGAYFISSIKTTAKSLFFIKSNR